MLVKLNTGVNPISPSKSVIVKIKYGFPIIITKIKSIDNYKPWSYFFINKFIWRFLGSKNKFGEYVVSQKQLYNCTVSTISHNAEFINVVFRLWGGLYNPSADYLMPSTYSDGTHFNEVMSRWTFSLTTYMDQKWRITSSDIPQLSVQPTDTKEILMPAFQQTSQKLIISKNYTSLA